MRTTNNDSEQTIRKLRKYALNLEAISDWDHMASHYSRSVAVENLGERPKPVRRPAEMDRGGK